jgi:WD40 repeat protein
LATDRTELALATLARAIRDNPFDRALQERLVNTLKSRTFLVPTTEKVTAAESEEFGFELNSQVALCRVRQGRLLADATVESGAVVVQEVPGGSAKTFRLPRPAVIRSIALSPDGRWLAAATAEGRAGHACVWNRQSQQVAALLPHSAEVNAVDFSPVQSVMATADANGVVRIWQPGSFTNLAEVSAHRAPANSVRFHPSAPILMSGGDDGFVRTWQSNRLLKQGEARSLGMPVEDIRLARNGTRVFVRLGPKVMSGFKWSEPVAPVQQSPPSAPNPGLEPIATVLGLPATNFHAADITCTSLSPRGDRLATASADQSARIWDLQTRHPLSEPLLHQATVNAVQFSPDGLRLATSTADRRMRVWDVATGVPLTDWLETDGPVQGVSFSAEGGFVIASTGQAWAVERAQGRAPEWLPALAEAIAMLRINQRGIRESLAPAEAAELCRRVVAEVAPTPANGWFQTFAVAVAE